MAKISKLQLEEFFKSRRSYYPKHFTGEQIEDVVVEAVLEFAGMAPNHKKTKPWRFRVFKNDTLDKLVDEMKQYYIRTTSPDEISELKLGKFEEKKIKSSHILAILVKKDEKRRVPEIEEIMAVACAVENISLALSTYGLGGYWSTGKYTYDNVSREYLKLSPDEVLLGFFVLGVVKDRLPSAESPDTQEYLSWVK